MSISKKEINTVYRIMAYYICLTAKTCNVRCLEYGRCCGGHKWTEEEMDKALEIWGYAKDKLDY